MLGPTQGSIEEIEDGVAQLTLRESLEHKKQLWKSIKHRFRTLRPTSTDDSITTSSIASSDSDQADDSLIDLSQIEVTTKTFIGLVNSANVQLDPTESTNATPIDSDSDKTLLATNTSHQGIDPLPLVTLDSLDNVDGPRAMIDT